MWLKHLFILLISCAAFNLLAAYCQAEETGTEKVQVEYLPNQVEDTEAVESLPDYFFVKVQKNNFNSYPQTNEQKNKLLFLVGVGLVISIAYVKESYKKVI